MDSVLKFITKSEISPDILDSTIVNIQDLNSLNALLDIKLQYIKNSSNHKKINFDPSFIYANNTENNDFICEVLKKALQVLKDIEGPLRGISTYIIENSQDLSYNLKITRLLHCLVLFCSEENNLGILRCHLSPEFVNALLLQALLQKDTKIRAFETLRCYFLALTSSEQIQCVNAIYQFGYQNNDLDVLCAILNQVSGEIFENESSCFATDKFWIYLESCISGTETYLQNQGEFIFLKCVKSLQIKNANRYLGISSDVDNTWEAFFMLLDVGREKQLHLVEPALVMLKYVYNLPLLWQKCIYRIYLRHSQNSIVYKVATYLLNQTYNGDNLRDILKLFLSAVNKNEYSKLSCEMFRTFHTFCLNLDKKDFNILLEEILLVSWNPISFWKIIQCAFVLESKTQIYIDYFAELLHCAASLPHIYIRNKCIRYLIKIFWDKKSFFKMHKIVCALQKTNIDYFKYNCVSEGFEYSSEIGDFVINELINSSDSDPKKSKICVMFAKHYDAFSTLSRYFNKFSPHVKLLIWDTYFHEFEIEADKTIFYRQMEQFLIQYFTEFLHEDTVLSFVQVFSSLARANEFPLENAALNIVDALSNPDNYNKNQIYVAFALLRNSLELGIYLFDRSIDKTIGQTVIDNWKFKIIAERDERICKEYIALIFAVNSEISSKTTTFIIELFSSMFECQNNEVLDFIYEKTYTLLHLCESKDLVSDFINLCHENLRTLKKDQYFKGIAEKLIKIVYTQSYFQFNLKNLSQITRTLFELSEIYPVIRLYWIRAIYRLYKECTEEVQYFHYFLLPTIDIYLQGLIVTKDDRTEFFVCQELLQDVSFTKAKYGPWDLCETSNPNLLSAASKILALEVLLMLAKRDTDLVTDCLREKYLTFFKKRYFPGSEIHFKKLRIIQAIMLLIPYVQQTIRTTRQISIFAYDCCLEEANQNCIKQFFDWFIILLLKAQGFAVIEYIRRITTFPTPASASVLVGLVPAVYHLTILGDEEAFNETIRLALPLTMGAHFKLRVYAQDLIIRLFKHARQNNYTEFLKKYKHLEDCIDDSIKTTSTVVENTMKADLLFINDFDLFGDNSLKTIFCDIPRLNNVCLTEWQNMLFYISRPECLKDNEVLYERTPLKSETTTFSDAVDDFLNKENSQKQGVIPEMASLNIQKKITPWKSALDGEASKVKSNFILIASLIDKPQNLGGLSRTCEVFGIKTLVLNDVKVTKDKEFMSLSMSSESWVNAMEVKVKDLEDYILKCQAEGYCVVGAEQTACSVKLNEFRFPQKTALILGNEKTGIPPRLIPLLNACLEIPQFGQVRSLNVHVAGATFIWEYAKQHLV